MTDYLAQNILDVFPAQILLLVVIVVHDGPISLSYDVVLVLVAASKLLILGAKFQVKDGPERGSEVQALGVSKDTCLEYEGEDKNNEECS